MRTKDINHNVSQADGRTRHGQQGPQQPWRTHPGQTKNISQRARASNKHIITYIIHNNVINMLHACSVGVCDSQFKCDIKLSWQMRE